MIAGLALRIVRRAPLGRATGFGLRWFACALPLDRLLCTSHVVVFRHPRPAYDDHLLIVPRRGIGTLLDLVSHRNARPLVDILTAARYALRSRRLPAADYTLIVNGGPRQEVRQVHFHLFSGPPVVRPYDGEAWWAVMDLPDGGDVAVHPSGDWPTHLVLLPGARLPPLSRMTPGEALDLARMLAALPDLDVRYGLERHGYALVIQERGVVERDQFVAHLVTSYDSTGGYNRP